MEGMPNSWDYLIITASNNAQARAYESQVALRRKIGMLSEAGTVKVVADPGGRRIGSGGSTIECLLEVLNLEIPAECADPADPSALEAILRRLRILIIHAGGDSRRLPAYGPCGKIFVPVPGESDGAFGMTLFESQLPTYLALPPGREGSGQVVVASGEAAVRFDPSDVRLFDDGATVLGCHASPEAAARHGVLCTGRDDRVRLYLQKPEPAAQARVGAINRYGQAILDTGILSFDAPSAMVILRAFGIHPSPSGKLEWPPALKNAVHEREIDLYREICCAMGSDATAAHHLANAHHGGSLWSEEDLRRFFRTLSAIPFRLQVLSPCSFLPFGSTRHLITSGLDLLQQETGFVHPGAYIGINNEILPGGQVLGSSSWVEGCRLKAPLKLGGQNVVVGVDVDGPLALPANTCLDVCAGTDRHGRPAWFVKCYGVNDSFKDPVQKGSTFCGRPILEWISAIGAKPEEIWDPSVGAEERSLWNARVFPAEEGRGGYHRWIWMYDPASVPLEQKRSFLTADRYSAEEIAVLADQEAFHTRRKAIRVEEIRRSLRRLFRKESGFSAEELAHALGSARDRTACAAEILADAYWHWGSGEGSPGLDVFTFCRIIHSLGTAVYRLAGADGIPFSEIFPGLAEKLPNDVGAWLRSLGLSVKGDVMAREWSRAARALAFDRLRETVLRSAIGPAPASRWRLRYDETIWGRAPARIELGGGWTDTPPYTLESGGCVVNAAVDLNGQPPIHCYGRLIREPVIRLSSIDLGQHIEISLMEDLVDFQRPGDSFALAKAVLSLSGLGRPIRPGGADQSLRRVLEDFGGGIELTTLVGIPKGSGLGTSSIIVAVLVAVLRRMMGQKTTQREILHEVLRLEQALGAGDGWQSAIGGTVGGTKITTTGPGLIPDPRIHYIPGDVLDPKLNGGSTLLYYTGIAPPATDFVAHVVGNYFDRNRTLLSALARQHQLARGIADALARKDAHLVGRCLDEAWRLQKSICGDGPDPSVESILEKVGGRIFGSRILGAASGGFLLMVCRSPKDAAAIREILEAEPPNDRARFFDFGINQTGLEVTAC